jgi:hypothetical protein
VKEEPVFWLGGRPGTPSDVVTAPASGSLEPAVRAACRALGVEPEDFVAALGGYGSWLVHFTRTDRRERIVWNGRERQLVLQKAIRSGGWEDVHACDVASTDEAGLAAGIKALLVPDRGTVA